MPINIFALDFSSSMAALDSNLIDSRKPPFRPNYCFRDKFYLLRWSKSFCFLKLSFYASVSFPLVSWSYFSSSSSGWTVWESAISFILFLWYYCSRVTFNSLNSWSLAISESLSIEIWLFIWVISSSANALILVVVSIKLWI